MLQNRWLPRGLFRTRECPRTMPAVAGTHSSPGRRCFRSTASTGTPTGACSGSTSHTSGNPPAVRGAERRVTQTAGQPIRWTPKTLHLLLSLLPTLISESHRVWVRNPTAGNHSGTRCSHDCCSAPSAAGHPPTLPALLWNGVSEASYSTDKTEMLRSATNQEKQWPSSLLCVWKWVTHPV